MNKEMTFRVPMNDLIRRIVEYSIGRANAKGGNVTVSEESAIVQEILSNDFEWGFKVTGYEIHNK